jgi:hypothetical protein
MRKKVIYNYGIKKVSTCNTKKKKKKKKKKVYTIFILQ